MLLLLTSLLFTEPAPLDMPRAEAYLVKENKVQRMEDRFNRLDLWVSQAVEGRWVDAEGRVFILSRLVTHPPAAIAEDSTVTRTAFDSASIRIDRRDKEGLRAALAALSPIPLAEKETPPRQMPRGFKDVDYWQGTNQTAIVCAFRLEKAKTWHLATWQLVEGDDCEACRKLFEKELFEQTPRTRWTDGLESAATTERERLRRDARHSVAAYETWHATDTPTYEILDDLAANASFVTTLTNDLVRLQAAYAETLPTPLDGTNTLCVARIYATRDEYQASLETEGLTNLVWSAAYWCQQRRELVAYLPDGGEKELLKTFRHEAFHQYLSYAASMLPTSPWLNEGYAQYFEEVEDTPRCIFPSGKPTLQELEDLSVRLPSLLMMDYEDFYDGSDAARRLKYSLAHSIVYFLEKGAPKVRFAPFKNLKRDYIAALLETKDMTKATLAAFGSSEKLELFTKEWLKFWKCTPVD